MDTAKKDILGSGWMLVAAACFTIMNVLIKEASAKFALGSGELVFWRMLFSTVALGAAAVLRRDTFLHAPLKTT